MLMPPRFLDVGVTATQWAELKRMVESDAARDRQKGFNDCDPDDNATRHARTEEIMDILVIAAGKTFDRKYASSVPSYGSIDAPPSSMPPRRYCAITGYAAKYRDPVSKIRYATVEVYQMIRSLGVSILQQYQQAASEMG
eukprot:g3217.t1